MRIRTLKLPKDLDASLSRRAARMGLTRSAVVREALAAYLGHAGGRRTAPPSFLDAAADLVGAVSGPADLSTNRRHLDDFGK
jgi:hypothetical protein